MFLRQINDSSLAQNAYLIGCQRSGEALLVDPERDLDRYFQIAKENQLSITAVADTHIHADYLSGARELVERHKVTAYLSEEGGLDWQFEWAKGNPNTRFLRHNDTFHVGNIEIKALLTPGHTPEHMSFLVTDIGGSANEPVALLSGDFLFVGDVGRPDLLESAAGQIGVMESSARTLYQSLRATSNLADYLQILPAHGAGSACGKSLGAVPNSVMGYERKFNAPFREALTASEDQFVKNILTGQPEPPLYFARMKRDNKLGPALLPDGKLPTPTQITQNQLSEWIGTSAILDLRSDKVAFAKNHLPGALFTPLLGGYLPIAAGSYIEDNSRILLVVEHESQVQEAVRQLIRIGLDRVEGWILIDEIFSAPAFTASYPQIQTRDLPANATVLDVRRADEFEISHVSGAKNIAYTRLAARLEEVPNAEPLYIHCAGGTRAAMAASYLAHCGIEIVHVDGSFSEIPASMLQ